MLRPRNSSVGFTEDGVPLFPRDAEEWRFGPGGTPDSPSNIIGRTYRRVYAWFRKALNGYYTKEETDSLLAPKYVKPAGGIPASDLAPGVIPRFPDPVDPAGASSPGSYSDAKLTRDLINKSVSDHSAHYLTYDASGSVFPSAAALRAASSFYYAGGEFEPTNNDWAIVRADEEHQEGGVSPSSKWIYVKPAGSESGEWQFTVSYRSQFTTAQLAALDSGADRGKFPVRDLPKYLHALSFDDTYPDDAAWLYAQLGPSDLGRCSAVRRGGKLWRNYDWTFDSSAEFAVRVSGSPTRFASVGMASVGSRLTENEAAGGVYSRYFRCLPGMTLDGINEKGVVCEINVDGGPKDGWHGDADEGGIHILAAVRWVLDNGLTATGAAAWLASHVIRPAGEMNFHFMVADAESTWIVENGAAHDVTDGTKVLTNYGVYDLAQAGGGKERYDLLAGGEDIRSVWFTNAYRSGNDWDSDFESASQHAEAIRQWAEQGETKEAHRGRTTAGGRAWWQSVHTTEYDFASKTMKVAVQEQDEWFTFAVDAHTPSVEFDAVPTEGSQKAVRSGGIWSWVKGLLNSLTLPWSKVTGKPSAFPPSAHTHTQSQVTGLTDALAAKRGMTDRSWTDETDEGLKFVVSNASPSFVNGEYTFVPAASGAVPMDGWYQDGSASTYFFRNSGVIKVFVGGIEAPVSPHMRIELPGGAVVEFDVAQVRALDTLALSSEVPAPVTLEDSVTRTSANGVKSSGIWSAVWGALTALPTGFTSLYDWCVDKLAGKLDINSASGSINWESVYGVPVLKIRAEHVEAGPNSYFLAKDFRTEDGHFLSLSANETEILQSFSESSTYEVGEIVAYLQVAYKCTTAVTTAGGWTGSANWTAAADADLAARFKGLKSDGTATDGFATDLLGKQVAKAAIGGVIADRVSSLDPEAASVYDLIKALKGE